MERIVPASWASVPLSVAADSLRLRVTARTSPYQLSDSNPETARKEGSLLDDMCRLSRSSHERVKRQSMYGHSRRHNDANVCGPLARSSTLEQSTFTGPDGSKTRLWGLQGLASCSWRSENGAAASREGHSFSFPSNGRWVASCHPDCRVVTAPQMKWRGTAEEYDERDRRKTHGNGA